jgi:hypothetical protein
MKFKKILKTSTSKVNLETKIKCLDDEAFSDPLLKARLTELKENAAPDGHPKSPTCGHLKIPH